MLDDQTGCAYHDTIANELIECAILTGHLSRSDFNIVRRTGALMSAGTRELWLRLNESIAHGNVQIVEDGDTIFEMGYLYADGMLVDVVDIVPGGEG